MGRLTRVAGELWRSARRPHVLQHCCRIALVVGALLTLVNQEDVLLSRRLDALVGLKIIANFLIPFVVSNLGAMVSLPRPP